MTGSRERIAFLPRARLAACVLVAALLAAGSGPAAAIERRAQFLVQATVLPVARVTQLTQPQEFDVTPVDAARGYVEVLQPTVLSVRSNTEGFVIDVRTRLAVLSGIEVRGLEGSVSLVGEGGSIVEHRRAAAGTDVVLTYRLVLTPGTAPGRYVWPLDLAVRPYRPE